ncbi:hypothetical protein, variant 2 [Aphanomyces astaci]|uniref:Uncharacterized protein n=1 Tax=Aphanomyces astaci TaxID=112090 RepID=W4GY61_APHAT|nr:hypothetical protein, variant 2 [Aphanomyces astaci]ETV83858.1 hypothetical protein, variant 2 [Aphanomyces astaci]|eukprot:XP_009827287.1 hypothetical protein, variant 2 [Aphanomyces astaci]
MDVRKVALPAGFAPYSSWNSSLSEFDGASTCSMTCENGAIIALEVHSYHRHVKVVDQVRLGVIGLERFCHAWTSTPTARLAVAHGDTLFIYDDKFERRSELQLPFFAKHVAFHGATLVASTSNGAYVYHVCPTTVKCILKHQLYSDVPVGLAAFSRCGAWCGIAAIDGRFGLWNVRTAMQLEFSTTLPSARPTSIAFSGDKYAVVACKDAHVAVFQRDNASSCTWSQLSAFSLKPESVASSAAYMSSTLVAAWKSVPVFFSVVHSSTHMDIIDASTGRRVHHMTFPSHVHLMGLVAVDDNAMLMQDMQGTIFSVTWSFAKAMAGCTRFGSFQDDVAVYDGAFGTLYLERQALRRTPRNGQPSDVLPLPFVPPHGIDPSNREEPNPSSTTSLSVHWMRQDYVVVVYGHAVYRYARNEWAVAVVPTGVHRVASSTDGPLVLVVLGQNDLMVLDVDTLATTSVHAVPPQVSALPAFLAPSMTMHVERHASTALVRLVDNDVEFWRYPVTC